MRTDLGIGLVVLICSTSISGLAQTLSPSTPVPRTAPSAPTAQDDEVVRITTNLVQLDVTVTDNAGNLVPDLKAEDFEILENNKTQKISNFSYVSLASAAALVKTVTRANAPSTPPVPTALVRPEQVRRTFALVVDDLGLSFESTGFVRRALRNFIDHTMQPGDLVAILRTRSGDRVNMSRSVPP